MDDIIEKKLHKENINLSDYNHVPPKILQRSKAIRSKFATKIDGYIRELESESMGNDGDEEEKAKIIKIIQDSKNAISFLKTDDDSKFEKYLLENVRDIIGKNEL